MPIITVQIVEDVFSAEQKSQMITRLTDAMVAIEGENMRSVTWVVVEEIKQGQLGIGGNPITTADVRSIQHGEAAA